MHGLLVVPRTDALAHHRDHGKAQGLAGDDAHAVQIVGHRIGGDLHGAEGGDHAHYQDAPGLEQAVLKGRRDADAQDAPCHTAVQMYGLGHLQCMAFLVALAQDEGRRHHTGHHTGPCHAVHAHFQAEDAHGVAYDVDDVHQHADLHRDPGIAHTAEQCRARVVQRQERVADRNDLEVQRTGIQHIGVNGAVEQPDHGPRQHKAQQPHAQAQDAAEQNQLPGALVGALLLPCAQELAHHHGTAGGQRREQHDDQVVDHVHQTDAGNGGLAAAGHHHGIGHAHRHGQELLHQQRPSELQQL